MTERFSCLLAALALALLPLVAWTARGPASVSALEAPAPCQLAEPADPGACLGLEKTVTTVSLTPLLDFTFSGPATAVPGDTLSYGATLTNRATSLSLSGLFRARNSSVPEANLASYYDYVEYYSKAESRWVALAGVARSRSGYNPQVTAPTSSGLDLTAAGLTASGVTYPTSGDPLLDTAVSRDATAAWDYSAKVELTPSQVTLLLDPARVGSVRNVVHLEFTRQRVGGGEDVSRKTRKTYLTKQLRTQSGDLRDAQITLTPPSGSAVTIDSTQTPSLARLEAGSSATVTADEDLPAISPKGASETDAAYLARLDAADGEELGASTQASGKATGEAALAAPGQSLDGTELLDEVDRCELVESDDCRVVVGPDRTANAPGRSATGIQKLPILSLSKSGPAKSAAGTTVTYSLDLDNVGGASAREIELQDRVESGSWEPVVDEPATLGPTATATAHASYNIPESRPNGTLTDTAKLSWKDANDNSYGPISDDFTTRVISSTLDAPAINRTSTTSFLDATKFLYTGDNPVQEGVAAGTIDARRAAVIRGRVLSRSGAPLFGVKAAVVDHPELGFTESRPDGAIYLAVNGGGPMTVRFEKDGYLPLERHVEVPWQDYAELEDVVLSQLDAQSTDIDLNSSSEPIQAARGSEVTDEDGTRRQTLLFETGTEATMELPGGDTQSLEDLDVRATEYTVGEVGPEAMSGELPPTSAYTYAAELSVDQALAADATAVRFSEPVISYTDNFIGIPVGEVVPVGYYDPEKGAWIPSENGRVVKLLSEAGGIAELDLDGSGQAASSSELGALGVSDDERRKLSDLYDPGKTLWRVPLSHFSSVDYNWSHSPPADAEPPPGELRPGDLDDPCKVPENSVIECENQTLGEELPVTGTPFSLHYQSDRVAGRKVANRLEIPVSGSSVPQSLKRIEVETSVAGRRFTDQLPASPNQEYTFTWDGKDLFGRTLQGTQPVSVRIGYVYDAVYKVNTRFGDPATGVYERRSRQEITLVRDYRETVGHWDAQAEGLGGWTLDGHHAYDPVGRSLYLGDGSHRSAESVGRVVERAAGSGVCCGFGGDGGPATQASLQTPSGLGMGPDGSFYIADAWHNRIRRVAPSGTITTVAGNGAEGFAGDGGPATQAKLASPRDVEVGPDGSLYIADYLNRRIRRVSPAGTITTIAGSETWGPTGGTLPATEAALGYTHSLAVAPDGSVYVSEYGNYASGWVRRVGPDGIITTVTGQWTPGFSGDGGPASDAAVRYPGGLALAPDGSLYIADAGNARIRRVSPDGTIETVVGTGNSGHSGDGGPATAAEIAASRIDVAPDGILYIAEDGGYVRKVAPEGTITTVAGGGVSGNSADGTPATNAFLDGAQDVILAPDGSLLVSADRHRVVFRVRPSLPGFSAGEISIPSEDGRELYQFDSSGRHLRTLDTLTKATVLSFAYDSAGRLTSLTDGDGNVAQIERDGAGKPTAIVAPFGQRTEISTNSDGYLSAVSNPESETTGLGYSSDGLLTSLTDPKGGSGSFTYDSLGRLTGDDDRGDGYKTLSRTQGSSSYETTLRSALGRESKHKVEHLSSGDLRRTLTDSSGLQATQRRNQNGSVTATTPDGTTASIQKGPDPRFGLNSPILASLTTTTPGGRQLGVQGGRQTTLSNASDPLSLQSQTETMAVNGRSYTTVFNAGLKRFTTTSPANRATTTDIDAQGRPLQEQVTGLETVSSTYNARGLLATQTQGARTWTYTYNTDGYLASATSPLSTTSFTFDGVGRVTGETLPGGREVAFSYDQNGNLSSVTPPSRPAHGFDHTPLDLVSDYTPPNLGQGPQPTHYTYNADRDLTRVTKPGNVQVDLAYDSAGRLGSVTQPSGQTTLAYDSQTGKLSSVTAPGNEQIEFEFDGSLPTSETFSGTVSGNVTRAYDNDFRLASSSVNGSNTVGYTYDSDSLLTGVGQLSLTRDSQNGILRSTSLQNTADSLTYNSFGEPTSFSATHNSNPIFSATYSRDTGGRVAQKTETTSQGTHTYAYTYDAAGRLTDVTRDGGPHAHYDYDTNGNRLSRTSGGVATYGTYDAQDRLTDYGQTDYTYTAAGDLRRKTDTQTNDETTYDYDALGSLRDVALPSGTTIDYVVDGLGRRIAKKRDGQLVQRFLYGEALGPVAELDAQGSVQSRFIYATHSNVPDYVTKNGNTYRIVTDELGSPRVVLDANTGAVSQELDYDEFGNVTQDTNPGFQPFGFAGGLYDTDTKLVRFGARDYDPESGRWTAKDPIGFSGGDTNLYGYVLSDPINWTDSDGLIGVPKFVKDAGMFVSNTSRGALNSVTFGVSEKVAGALGAACPGAGFGLGSALGDVGGLAIPIAGALKAGRLAAGAAKGGKWANDVPASTLVGRRGSPLNVPRGTNTSATIKGRQYSGHALDEMQSEGFVPSVVEDAIANGQVAHGTSGRVVHYSAQNNISVVLENDRVITVSSGRFRPK